MTDRARVAARRQVDRRGGPGASPARRRRILAVLLAGAAMAGACRAPAEGDGEGRRYRVRGVVRQVAAGPAVPLLVEHEAIPDLLDASGAAAPMAAMTMPFPVAGSVDLAALELAAGDVVALTVEVDWEAPSAIVVMAVERLPADTQLDIPSAGRSPAR